MQNKQKFISAITLAATSGFCAQAHAVLPSNAILNFNDPVLGGYYGTTVIGGSYFAMDTNGDNTFQKTERTGITQNNGVALGTTQTATGSHSGAPDGSESPGIDNPWGFFGNTGMHQTTSPTAIISTTGSSADLDFSGWNVTWNGISSIPMGAGASNGVATIICAVDCSNGDTYTLDYFATVPLGDPSGFGGVKYALHLEGTIVVPNSAPVTSSFSTTGIDNSTLLIDLAANTTDADNNLDVTTVNISNSTACNTITDNNDGTVTFPSCPAGNYTFDYSFDDTLGATSNVSTVTVTLSANPAPNTQADSATTNGNTPVVIDVLTNDTDDDGTNPATVTVTNGPSNGNTSVNTSTGEITYTANNGFSGSDNFTYTVEDNTGQVSADTNVTVTVNALNVPSTNGVLTAGAIAASVGSTSGVISFSDINVEDNGSTPEQGITATCVGGCFDFTITGFIGSEAQIILPLSSPLATLTDPTSQYKYRKLDANGNWNDFDTSGANAIHTAVGTLSGTDVVCPVASAPEYDANSGLTEGHQCVRLTIVDGSPNDSDNSANGSISDPGGIAVTTQVDTRTSGTDGCSMTNQNAAAKDHAEWLLVAAFVGMIGWLRSRNRDCCENSD